MLSRLALLFILIPFLELVILIQLGRGIGFLPTLALVVFSGVLGATLVRTQGLRALWSVRSEVEQGRIPARALLDGLAILVAGAFLMTPGLVTDLMGFALLFPATRRWIQARMLRGFEKQVRSGRIQMHVLGDANWAGRAGGSGLDPSKEVGRKDPS